MKVECEKMMRVVNLRVTAVNKTEVQLTSQWRKESTEKYPIIQKKAEKTEPELDGTKRKQTKKPKTVDFKVTV